MKILARTVSEVLSEDFPTIHSLFDNSKKAKSKKQPRRGKQKTQAK